MPSILLPQLAIARRGPDDPLHFHLGRDAGLEALSEDIVWPSEIEGEACNRSGIPRSLTVPSRVNAGPPPGALHCRADGRPVPVSTERNRA